MPPTDESGAHRARGTGADALRVLITDDSSVYRSILRRLLTSVPGVEVVGEACNGREALEHIGSRRPDLVLLDCEMPELDGLATLRVLQHSYPDLPVFMVSSLGDAEHTTAALRLGAWDFIVKPGDAEAAGPRLLGRLVAAVSSVRRARSLPERDVSTEARPSAPIQAARNIRKQPFECLVIAASTGGPRALERLLPHLPATLAVPVLVVQHMPAGFTESLARGLARCTPMPVLHAESGHFLEPGRTWIAAGGTEIRIERVPGGERRLRIALRDDGPSGQLRPSADVLMQSLADTLRGPVLSVVLTGMGEDARAGVSALKAHGGSCIAQDQSTSTVFGMPRAVIEAGLADHVLPLDAIPSAVTELIESQRRSRESAP